MNTEEIINYIKQTYVIKGKYPTIADVIEVSGETPENVKKIYKHYFNNLKKRQINKRNDKSKSKKTVRKYKKNVKTYSTFFIRILMGFVGIILVICSIHFTYNFNSLGMDKLWAFLISFALVVFTSFALTMASLVKGKTSKLVYFLWIIGVTYSIFTAIASQYNDFRKYSSKDNSQPVIIQTGIYEEQLKELELKQKDLLHWRIEESEYTSNPDLKIENPKTWETIKKGVFELKEVENNIESTRNHLIELSLENTDENKTIYHWLSQIFHIKSDLIQFIIIVFPSVFLDLCAGILLKFAFIVDDKNK